MKLIRDENTATLIVTFIVFIIICFFAIKWDIYETEKCKMEGKYRDLNSKIKLRGGVIILLIGIFTIAIELYKRL